MDILSLLERFGFPAVAFGMMFYLVIFILKRLVPVINRLEISISRLTMVLLKREQEIDECRDFGKK